MKLKNMARGLRDKKSLGTYGLERRTPDRMAGVRCPMPPNTLRLHTNRRAENPLVRLVEGEERWEAPDHLQGVLPQNWDGTESNRAVTCMVLEATTNDKSTLPRWISWVLIRDLQTGGISNCNDEDNVLHTFSPQQRQDFELR
ncbi:hypothetical protein TNCV_4429581 [Trichonephila clavipes]|nr:hypothetical protein TNCV_4429581 [Trichonephila clavipes]